MIRIPRGKGLVSLGATIGMLIQVDRPAKEGSIGDGREGTGIEARHEELNCATQGSHDGSAGQSIGLTRKATLIALGVIGGDECSSVNGEGGQGGEEEGGAGKEDANEGIGAQVQQNNISPKSAGNGGGGGAKGKTGNTSVGRGKSSDPGCRPSQPPSHALQEGKGNTEP